MATINTNTVYVNKTDRVIAIGTLTEIKDYLENPGRYTVAKDYNGAIVSK